MINKVASIYQKRLDSISKKDSSDFKSYYLYKEGNCYLNNVSEAELFSFITYKLEWTHSSAFDTLKSFGFVVEKVFRKNDYLIAVQKYNDEKAKIMNEFKWDLFHENNICALNVEHICRAEKLFNECSKEKTLEEIEILFNRFVKCI